MLVKELFLSAFVKGIGKTTGSVAILGLMSCAWFLINRIKRIKSKDPSKNTTEFENSQVNMENIEEVFDLSSNGENLDFNYKKIFDKL